MRMLPLDDGRHASYEPRMPSVGDIVKPRRRVGGPWRLGVVERVYEDGRVTVRSYVAPPRSYEGSAATYAADEVVVVPREDVERALRLTRARLAQQEELARQIANALDAATK